MLASITLDFTRVFVLVGLSLFTMSSAAAAIAPDIGMLIAARAVQGVGAAIVAPLTLTLLSAAVPATRRGLALGAWGAMSGLAVALGPVIGGAIVDQQQLPVIVGLREHGAHRSGQGALSVQERDADGNGRAIAHEARLGVRYSSSQVSQMRAQSYVAALTSAFAAQAP